MNIQYAEAIPWFKLQGTADQIRSSEKFSEISGHIEIIEVLGIMDKIQAILEMIASNGQNSGCFFV